MFFCLTALVSALLFTAVFGIAVETPENTQKRDKPTGIVVSFSNNFVDWKRVSVAYHSFAYIWATAGDEDRNPHLSSHYSGAANAGLVRGAFHVAHPTQSSGAAQADYFLSNGGKWTGDGITLPGALSIGRYWRHNCHGLNTTAMVGWIRDFSDTYHSKVGRYPVISTTADWWNACTGNNADFGSASPLWNFHVPSPNDVLPAGWNDEPSWSSFNTPHLVQFSGDMGGLKRLTTNRTAIM